MCEPKMYLILREDLAYKYIQGGHALAAFALEHASKFRSWNNSYLINLSVFNGIALNEVYQDLITTYATIFPEEYAAIGFSIFVEPDLESSLPTAICIYEDGNGCVANKLKGLQLATK